MAAIHKAIEAAGGTDALARALKVTPGFVRQLAAGVRQVPPRQCIPIERASGNVVTRHQLRPDIFGRRPASRK